MSGPLKGEPPALWDPVVRLTHWALAVVVIGNALITRPGGATHAWLGWIGAGVLILRLGWGLVGAREARFSAFPPRPRAALGHMAYLVAGRPGSYVSHNPAGAVMVYALWASLGLVIQTGMMLTGFATPVEIAAQKAAVASGDWASLAAGTASGLSRETRHLLGDVHAVMANLMLVLAVAHVAGVALESAAMKRNLVRPMLLGARDKGVTAQRQ